MNTGLGTAVQLQTSEALPFSPNLVLVLVLLFTT